MVKKPLFIPDFKRKNFLEPSVGEIFGNIIATKNVSFDRNRGTVRMSKRGYNVFSSDDSVNLGVAADFIKSDADGASKYWTWGEELGVGNVGALYKTSGESALSGWAKDTIIASPYYPGGGNFVVFSRTGGTDLLLIPIGTSIEAINAGIASNFWQTTLGNSAMGNRAHPMIMFNGILLVADLNVIHTVDQNLVTVTKRLVLPTDKQVVWMAHDGNRVYIGMIPLLADSATVKTSGNAMVYPWDGVSETYDTPIPVYSNYTFAGCAMDGIMYTINGNGQLLAFNGTAFQQVAVLPCYQSLYSWTNSSKPSFNVKPTGMKLINGKINILLNSSMSDVETNQLDNFSSGLWEYDPQVGLYCKYSFGNYKTTDKNWGDSAVKSAGALLETRKDDGIFLAGLGVYSDNATTKIPGIFSSKIDIYNRGYFITYKMEPAYARGFWKSLSIVFKNFDNSTDRVIIKYRADKRAILENTLTDKLISLTWVNGTTFTTTSSTGANIQVGDEIEFICGIGGGGLANVISSTLVSGTYTVVLDETIPNITAGDKADARITNFSRVGTASDQNVEETIFSIIRKSSFIQFKVEMRGSDNSPELQKLILDYDELVR